MIGSRPRSRESALSLAFLGALVVAALAAAAFLSARGGVAPGLLALVVAVPLGATMTAAFLSRATIGVHLAPLVPAVSLNLIGLLVLTVIAPTFAYLQCFWSLVCLLGYTVVVRHSGDTSRLRRVSLPLFALALGLVLLTFVAGVNPSGAGQRQWLSLGPFYFEPSELLKLSLMLALTLHLAGPRTPTDRQRPWAYVAIGLSLVVLVLQGDLGAAFMVAIIGALVMYAADGGWGRLVMGAGVLAVGGSLAYLAMPYVRLRFDSWLNPWSDPGGASYQVVQGLRALAAGGAWGKGLLAADTMHVPAAHTDSILTVIGERLGLVGTLATVGLYALLLLQLRRAYLRADTAFHALLATGVAILLVGQAVLIGGGSTGLLPLTGVTLPLVSYGGSSLLMSYLAVALAAGRNGCTSPGRLPRSRTQDAVYLALAAAVAVLALWLSLWHLAGAEILSRLLG